MYAKDIWKKDLNKDIIAMEKGIKLIRIKEFDWDNDPTIKEIIKSYLWSTFLLHRLYIFICAFEYSAGVLLWIIQKHITGS